MHSTKTGDDAQVNWIHYRHYLVVPDTVTVYRHCWICGEQFLANESVSICGTSRGNKLVHSNCYDAQMTWEAGVEYDPIEDYFNEKQVAATGEKG